MARKKEKQQQKQDHFKSILLVMIAIVAGFLVDGLDQELTICKLIAIKRVCKEK